MVKIRLSRFGKKGQPTYRVVAIQARDKRQGEALEYLGHYNPRTKPSTFEINKERVEYWLKVGAQPSETVRKLLVREKLLKPIKKEYHSKPGKKKQARMEAEKATQA